MALSLPPDYQARRPESVLQQVRRDDFVHWQYATIVTYVFVCGFSSGEADCVEILCKLDKLAMTNDGYGL